MATNKIGIGIQKNIGTVNKLKLQTSQPNSTEEMGVFIDGVDIGVIVAIGIDFALAYGFNKMYQHALRAALNIDVS